MTLLSLAPLRRPKPAPACDAGDAAATHALAASAGAVTVTPDDPRSCGWFDSSWELQHGLAVNEWAEAELPAAALWFADLMVADLMCPDLMPAVLPTSAQAAESAWLQ